MDEILIIIAIVALAAAVAIAWYLVQSRRSKQLRQQFGPEYEQAVGELGGRRRAEADLRERRERVERLRIVPLSNADAEELGGRWREVQARFVDDPSAAIREANALVNEAMGKRGYPMDNFEQRAADISVEHPRVVADYRAARAIAVKNEAGDASTEDLRVAMVHYRALFEDLLERPAVDQRERMAG